MANLFKTIRDRIKERGLNKLEKNLQVLYDRKNISFNPLTVSSLVSPISDKNYSVRLMEHYVWYVGSLSLLLSFYRKNKWLYSTGEALDDYNYFWGNVPIENRRVHSKLPQIISNKMADMLLYNGLDIETQVYTANDKGERVVDEEQSQIVKNVLMSIYKDNDFKKLLRKSMTDESWSGDIAWKLIIDTSFSNKPIIQEVDTRNYEIITKYGKDIGIVFKEYYERQNGKTIDRYVLEETYTKDENNNALIAYRLFKLDSVGKKQELPLGALEETAPLLDNPLFDAETQTITFNGLEEILAQRKPNRLPNAEFPNTNYGQSDYAGSCSLFDSLDETLSTMVDDIRKGRSLAFIPDTLIPRDMYGNVERFNDFKLRYQKVVGSDASTENENEITEYNPSSKSTEQLEKYKSILMQVCNSVGLSPLTLGITGLESIDASAQSQQEREKVSIRTRSYKIGLWQEFLEKISRKVLKTYIYMQKITTTGEEIQDKELKVIKELDIDNIEININFGDYALKPFDERLRDYGSALQLGSISIEKAVDLIYKDEMTEEQKQIEVDRIKMQKGFSLANEDNLLSDIDLAL